MTTEALGKTLRRLRRLAGLTQEELSERSSVSVNVIRQLEQRRKHSARLPTLHALANGRSLVKRLTSSDATWRRNLWHADSDDLLPDRAARFRSLPRSGASPSERGINPHCAWGPPQ
ncbi:hypothetical protein GCM10017562_42890 [Streptomyces roseofulvus]